MSFLDFSRGALRAPLKTNVIYNREENVRKAAVRNISETGILLSKLRKVDVGETLHMMVHVPLYPVFQDLSLKQIHELMQDGSIDGKVIRVQGRVVRAYTMEGGTDAGLHFDSVDDQTRFVLKEYINLYSQNIMFIISLFEQIGDNEQIVQVIRNLTGLMGYDTKEKISVLRQKVLHDYQNLEG